MKLERLEQLEIEVEKLKVYFISLILNLYKCIQEKKLNLVYTWNTI